MINSGFKQLGITLLVAASALLSNVTAFGELTPDGTRIVNQAYAEYFDDFRGVGAWIISNSTSIRVAPQLEVEITPPLERVVTPGVQVQFEHQVVNLGNTPDSYTLSPVNLLQDANGDPVADDYDVLDLRTFHDVNQNGVVDPGEPQVTQTAQLEPGENFPIIVTGSIPAGAQPNDVAGVVVSTVSTTAPGVNDLVQDIARIGDGAILLIILSGSKDCADTVVFDDINVYNAIINKQGNAGPLPRDIDIGGSVFTGVLFEVAIPPGLEPFVDSEFTAIPGPNSLVLFHRPAAADNVWDEWANWDGLEQIDRIGVIFEPNVLNPGSLFSVRVVIDEDGKGGSDTQSGEVCKAIGVEAPPARIRFVQPRQTIRDACKANPSGGCVGPDHASPVDADFVDVEVFTLDDFDDPNDGYLHTADAVYVELLASGENRSPTEADVTIVQVRSATTGDIINVTVVETGPNTGIFRSIRPISLIDEDTLNGLQCPSAGAAPVAVYFGPASDPVNCHFQSTPNDTLIASFRNVIPDTAIVNPVSTVFDSGSGTPLEGAVVRIFDVANPIVPVATLISDANGQYVIPPNLPPSSYFIDADTSGINSDIDYLFASAFPPSHFTLRGQVSGRPLVGEYSYSQNGFRDVPSSGLFVVTANSPPYAIDIPLDPDIRAAGQIQLEKNAEIEAATVGDFVPFTLKVTNGSNFVLNDVDIVDTLPLGFQYVIGSTRYGGIAVGDVFDPQPTIGGAPSLDALTVVDPEGAPGPVITFNFPRVGDGVSFEITYVIRVQPGAVNGSGINTATINAANIPGGVLAEVRGRVDIEEEPLISNDGYLFGKIYVDGDCNDEQTFREWPIGGVRLYMEDGTYVITDEHGQYSLYGVKPGNHVIKVDTTTLPNGVKLKPLDNRSAAYGESRFVDLIAGEWHRADFATMCPCGEWASVMEEIRDRNENVYDDWLLDNTANYRQPTGNATRRSRSRSGERGPDGDQSNGQVWGPRVSIDQFGTSRNAESSGRKNGLLISESTEVEPKFVETSKVARDVTREEVKAGTWFWPKGDVSNDGRFQVATRNAKGLGLYVDGERVAKSQLGEELTNRNTGGRILAWYGVGLDIGWHTVQVKGTDPFGNARVLAEKRVYKAGTAVGMSVTPRSQTANADGGRSALGFDVLTYDINGQPAIGTHYITLKSSAGRWLGEDIQDKEPEFQTRVVNGKTTVWLQTSSFVGKVDVHIHEVGGEMEDKSVIEFIEPMREMLAVGIVEYGVSANDITAGLNVPLGDGFEEGVTSDGRAALFLKGRVKGDMLLTLSYDTDKDPDEEYLFRDIDPNTYYPVYGDASVKGYEAQARSKLYVKLERGTKSIMWGDFASDVNRRASLARVQGSFTGLNGRWEGSRLSVNAFAANVDNETVSEEIPANGTSRDYQLVTAVPLVRNSENIEVVLRDRDNAGLDISVEPLIRFRDYVIDPISGRITLFRVVPVQDIDGNMFVIRVNYQAEKDAPEHLVAGVSAEYALVDWLNVGGSFSKDEDSADGYEIGSLHAVLGVDEANNLTIEIASLDSVKGNSGEAVRIEWKAKLSDRLSGQLLYARADVGFDHRGSGISSDREELRANASLKLRQSTSLNVDAILTRGISATDERQAIGLSLQQKLGGWQVQAGVRQIEQIDTSANRNAFTTGRVRLERSFEWRKKSGKFHVEYETALSGASADSLKVGASYNIHDRVSLYARHEVIDSLTGVSGLGADGTRRTNTVLGVDADVMKNTRTYTEYRQRAAISSQELESASGIRGNYQLGEGVTINPDISYTRFLQGAREGQEELAISVGYQNKTAKNSRTAGRVEYRSAETKNFYSFSATYVARLNLNWSSLLREDFQMDAPKNGDANKTRNTFTWGISRRPRLDSRHHMVAIYQCILEDNFDVANIRTSTHLVSTHQNYQLSADFRIGGQLAAKWQTAETTSGITAESQVQLAGIRFIKDLGRRIDVDVHAGILSESWGDSYLGSFGVGLNALVLRNLRAGIGYNFDGFEDSQLDADAFHRHGVYFNLAWKFDEHLFGWLAADDLNEKESRDPLTPIKEPIILKSLGILRAPTDNDGSLDSSLNDGVPASEAAPVLQLATGLRTSRLLRSRAE